MMTNKETWQDALAQGQARAALLLYRSADLGDETTEETLNLLDDIQQALRHKQPQKAERLLQELEQPADILDWQLFRSDFAKLKSASELLDERKLDEAQEVLSGINAALLAAEVETLKGTLGIYTNNLEAAEQHFLAAVVHDPKYYRAITNLGNLALERGALETAIAHYQEALGINDEFANAYHNLAIAYRKQGKIAKSVQLLKKAQTLSNKRYRDEARESLRGGRVRSFKAGRWLLYGAIILAIFFFLRNQGTF